MNFIKYDTATKSYSFESLNSDQIMDLTDLEEKLYRIQRMAWLCGEGETYELLLDMARCEALYWERMNGQDCQV